MTGVTLEDVTVRYGDVTGIDDLSIDVAPGEFFTLVGPSGCGKTTTLRTIAGFESPDIGRVAIGGDDVTADPPEDRDVGVVFQQYALFPHMSVRENVAYGLRFADPPGGVSTDARVADLLDLVDLGGMGDRDPETLSGGQRQRVALARALAPGPDVLLLDEPLSALDATLRTQLRVTIRDIQQDLGITTVYVTHDQEEALAISDRVAVLSEGRLEQVATPETVYREPATRFVADFVGENTLVDGEITGDGRFVAGDLDLPLPESSEWVSGSSTVALRPEAITTARADPDLTVTVDQVEFLGDAYRVHANWGDQTLTLRTTARPAVGETLHLSVDVDAVALIE